MVNPPIQMANLGMADSLILMVMALVVFGPRRLPQIGRQIGKLMYEFRKASNDFKFQMEEELRTSEDAERRQKEDERQRALVQPPPLPVIAATEEPAPLVGDNQSVEAAPSVEAAVPPAGLEPASLDPASLDPASKEPPSPDDGVYPPIPSLAVEVVGEEPHLRIMPPSTGEQVPAARPNVRAMQADLFAEPAIEPASDPGPEAPQAAHHG